MTIKKITARSIYDSRGNPTVEVDLITGKKFPPADPSELIFLRDRIA